MPADGIAEQFDLTRSQVEEALLIRQVHRTEVEALIAAECSLQAPEIDELSKSAAAL